MIRTPTVNTYNDARHMASHTTEHVVNHAVYSQMAKGVAATTAGFVKGIDMIGEVASCNYQNQKFMDEHGIFTPENNYRSRQYCSRYVLANSIPVHGTLQTAMHSIYMNNAGIKPEQLFDMTPIAYSDLGTIDKITYGVDRVSYVQNAIAGGILHDGIHHYTDRLGAVAGMGVERTMDVGRGVYNYFNQKPDVATSTFSGHEVHNPAEIQTRAGDMTIYGLSADKLFDVNNKNPLAEFVNPLSYNFIPNMEGMAYNPQSFGLDGNVSTGHTQRVREYYKQNPSVTLYESDNFGVSYSYDPYRKRYFKVSLIATETGFSVVIEGNPLVAWDTERTFSAHGFKGIVNTECHMRGFKIYHKSIIDDNFYDIHVKSKGVGRQSARENAQKLYFDQLKVKSYQVTGIPFYRADPNFKMPTIRYEKWIEIIKMDKLLNNWADANGLHGTERDKYFAIIQRPAPETSDKTEITLFGKKYTIDADNIPMPKVIPPPQPKEITFYDAHKSENILSYIVKYIHYLQTGEHEHVNVSGMTDKEIADYFVSLRNKRSDITNNALTEYENSVIADAKNHKGDFTRWNVIKDVNNRLLAVDVSAENIFATIDSALMSTGVATVAYADVDYGIIKRDGIFGYTKYKGAQFASIATQSYVTGCITNHITTTIGLTEWGDSISDKVLEDVVMPNVAAAVSTSISLGVCLTNKRFKKMNSGEKTRLVLENSVRANTAPIGKYIANKYITDDLLTKIGLVTQPSINDIKPMMLKDSFIKVSGVSPTLTKDVYSSIFSKNLVTSSVGSDLSTSIFSKNLIRTGSEKMLLANGADLMANKTLSTVMGFMSSGFVPALAVMMATRGVGWLMTKDKYHGDISQVNHIHEESTKIEKINKCVDVLNKQRLSDYKQRMVRMSMPCV